MLTQPCHCPWCPHVAPRTCDMDNIPGICCNQLSHQQKLRWGTKTRVLVLFGRNSVAVFMCCLFLNTHDKFHGTELIYNIYLHEQETIKTNVFIPIFPSSIPWQLPWEEHVYLPIHDMVDFFWFRVGSLPEINNASENHGWKIKSLFGARPFYPIFKGFGC